MALIAVVEHHLETLAFLCDALLTAGYGVVAFQHPDELTRGEKAIDVDLIVTDLAFSGPDGPAFARTLRERVSQDIPMIAISDSSFPLRSAVRSGLFQDTLSRPIDACALVESVSRVLPEQKQVVS